MTLRFLRPQFLLALFCMSLALTTTLQAQKDAGAIVGLVRDGLRCEGHGD